MLILLLKLNQNFFPLEGMLTKVKIPRGKKFFISIKTHFGKMMKQVVFSDKDSSK
jgi:hypothetical protein